MRKLFMAAGLVSIACIAAMPAMAQDEPKAEVSGGFSYFHAGRGGNLYGWDGSVAGNLNNWLGIVGEFSGHYQSNSSSVSFPIVTRRVAVLAPGPIGTFTTRADQNIYTFLFGPRFSYRKDKRLTPFAHVLPGFARSHVDGFVMVPPGLGIADFSFSDSATAFAMAIGGGLDIRLSRSWAFRAIQADYVLTHFAGQTQNNARITTGIVYRFGK
ncbi:MAG TPA: outer membrane beta-barrel protein [Blastocatellia bacterium]|nr:outer membrane beta-barrel protein [Blastocatellia bacterium]